MKLYDYYIISKVVLSRGKTVLNSYRRIDCNFGYPAWIRFVYHGDRKINDRLIRIAGALSLSMLFIVESKGCTNLIDILNTFRSPMYNQAKGR